MISPPAPSDVEPWAVGGPIPFARADFVLTLLSLLPDFIMNDHFEVSCSVLSISCGQVPLFGCLAEPCLCIGTVLCPCIIHGRIAEFGAPISTGTDGSSRCLMYGASYGACATLGGAAWMGCWLRGRIRERLGIAVCTTAFLCGALYGGQNGCCNAIGVHCLGQGSPVQDFWIHCCCPWCAMIQEFSTISSRIENFGLAETLKTTVGAYTTRPLLL